MSEIYLCPRCPGAEFSSRAERQRHQRYEHQKVAQVQYLSDGAELTIHRDEETNLFHCPRCPATYTSSSSLYAHGTMCFGAADLQQQEVDHATLAQFGLVYEAAQQALVCVSCQTAVALRWLGKHWRTPEHAASNFDVRLAKLAMRGQPSLGSTDVPAPDPNGAAIASLSHIMGARCTLCDWCGVQPVRHWIASHATRTGPESYTPAMPDEMSRLIKLQRWSSRALWFAVELGGSSSSSTAKVVGVTHAKSLNGRLVPVPQPSQASQQLAASTSAAASPLPTAPIIAKRGKGRPFGEKRPGPRVRIRDRTNAGIARAAAAKRAAPAEAAARHEAAKAALAKQAEVDAAAFALASASNGGTAAATARPAPPTAPRPKPRVPVKRRITGDDASNLSEEESDLASVSSILAAAAAAATASAARPRPRAAAAARAASNVRAAAAPKRLRLGSSDDESDLGSGSSRGASDAESDWEKRDVGMSDEDDWDERGQTPDWQDDDKEEEEWIYNDEEGDAAERDEPVDAHAASAASKSGNSSADRAQQASPSLTPPPRALPLDQYSPIDAASNPSAPSNPRDAASASSTTQHARVAPPGSSEAILSQLAQAVQCQLAHPLQDPLAPPQPGQVAIFLNNLLVLASAVLTPHQQPMHSSQRAEVEIVVNMAAGVAQKQRQMSAASKSAPLRPLANQAQAGVASSALSARSLVGGSKSSQPASSLQALAGNVRGSTTASSISPASSPLDVFSLSVKGKQRLRSRELTAEAVESNSKRIRIE